METIKRSVIVRDSCVWRAEDEQAEHRIFREVNLLFFDHNDRYISLHISPNHRMFTINWNNRAPLLGGVDNINNNNVKPGAVQETSVLSSTFCCEHKAIFKK